MYEKIKIRATKSLYDLLKKECVDFKIVKADGAPNMNSFLNNILRNYY